MKKVFIFWICAECNEPTSTVNVCNELGYNSFPTTNFHGELSIEETEKVRLNLIEKLRKDGNENKANLIEKNTKVYEITFTK